MRESSFAGSFYEAAPKHLEAQIRECFLSKFGPGKLPGKQTGKEIKAVICPHAGYMYSGACAAHAYKALAEAKIPDLYILIGPNHQSGQSSVSSETIQTPLGIIRADQNFARDLAAKKNLKLDDGVHAREHSVEVQLPFLQFVLKEKMDKVKIVPIIISHDADLHQVAIDIKETLLDQDKKAVFIVSSDFTHYGYGYGYVPFSENIKENLEKLDMGAVELIKKQDYNGFLNYVEETKATICGALPIALLLRTIKAKNVTLLKYYTSGEVVGDTKNSVSYVSMLFE